MWQEGVWPFGAILVIHSVTMRSFVVGLVCGAC